MNLEDMNLPLDEVAKDFDSKPKAKVDDDELENMMNMTMPVVGDVAKELGNREKEKAEVEEKMAAERAYWDQKIKKQGKGLQTKYDEPILRKDLAEQIKRDSTGKEKEAA